MDTEQMIRELRYLENRYKDCKYSTFEVSNLQLKTIDGLMMRLRYLRVEDSGFTFPQGLKSYGP